MSVYQSLALDLLREVEAFLFMEARYADDSSYDAWEALLTDDMHYWVPTGLATGNPADQLSYINDNRARVKSRIRQMRSSRRHAQTPPSPLRRVISNVEVLSVEGDAMSDGATIVVVSNFVLYELAAQSTHQLRIWPGRYTHHLRRIDGELKIAAKWVELVNATEPQPNMTFII
jgi:benzoate/toluate 1,2-dioxygenase beta subunit